MQSNGRGGSFLLTVFGGVTGNPFTIIAVCGVIMDTDASVEFIMYQELS